MVERAELVSPLEAAEAVRFVLPRFPDEAYVFPAPEGRADDEFCVYE